MARKMPDVTRVPWVPTWMRKEPLMPRASVGDMGRLRIRVLPFFTTWTGESIPSVPPTSRTSSERVQPSASLPASMRREVGGVTPSGSSETFSPEAERSGLAAIALLKKSPSSLTVSSASPESPSVPNGFPSESFAFRVHFEFAASQAMSTVKLVGVPSTFVVRMVMLRVLALSDASLSMTPSLNLEVVTARVSRQRGSPPPRAHSLPFARRSTVS
ncbi:hypothetical protein [Fretibacterium fastidiosum]|uniref:hypothetical protein n=1 Tax=Fretibacterium fastidiosum TaxID=651822 RepID=UPI001FB0C74E|nr:hypothetical protein [Fretibacterium fastidiosum]